MATTISDPTAQAIMTAAEQTVANTGAAQGIAGLQFDPTSAAAASTANAASAAAAANTPPAPIVQSTVDKIASKAGIVTGIGQAIGQFTKNATSGLGGIANTVLNSPVFQGAGGVLAAYGLFSSLKNVFANGLNAQTGMQLAMAAGGAAVAVYSLGMTLFINMTWAAFMPYVAVALAVIVLLAYFLGKKPNAAEQQIANFNNLTVWTSGQVLSLAAGSALMLMGHNIDSSSMTSLNTPGKWIATSTLNSLLANSLTNADGSGYSGGVPYGVPIVMKGAGAGGGDEVMIVSQGGIQNGVAGDFVQKYDLSNNMAFTKPTDPSLNGAYIPFFGPDGKPNPQAVGAVNTQRALLLSTPNLAAASQTNGVAVAAASNKQGVQATSVP